MLARERRHPAAGGPHRPRAAAVLRASLLAPPQPAGRPGDPGLFGPGTVTWAVCRERVVLAGGQAALLLQLAHPLVAAGVADHSHFVDDPYGRLAGTLQTTLVALFGDTEQARAVARRVGHVHRRVKGHLAAQAPGWPAGTGYDARDEALGRWVHATLAATMLGAHELLVGRVDPRQRERYHQEMEALATLFGVPAAALPPTEAEFRAYVDAAAATLPVTDQARALATHLLDPPRPRAFALAGPVSRLLTAGLLPERLRAAYGLPDSRRHRAARAALVVAIRALVRLTPPALRYWPHYRVARRRVAGMVAGGAERPAAQPK